MANYGMAFDYELCIDCHACEVACKEENGIALGMEHRRLWIQKDGDIEGDFWNIDKSSVSFMQMQCQNCVNPPCLEACERKAIYIDENAIVRIYKDKCDLLLSCMEACPYDARYIDDTHFFTDKCIFCADTRLARGETTTACQITCPAKLRYFGDLNDEESEIVQMLKKRDFFVLKESAGTIPKLFYFIPKNKEFAQKTIEKGTKIYTWGEMKPKIQPLNLKKI